MRKILDDFHTGIFYFLLIAVSLLVGELVPKPYLNFVTGTTWYALCILYWRQIKGEKDNAGLALVTYFGAVGCSGLLLFMKCNYHQVGYISLMIAAVLFTIFVKVQTAIYNTIKKCQK